MFNKFIRWFTPKKKIEEEVAMTVQFLKMLQMTEEKELSCSEVYELVDQFVELQASGENVEEAMPLVKRHLDMCRGCFEEYEALLAALALEESP